jgi:hypothetical protein
VIPLMPLEELEAFAAQERRYKCRVCDSEYRAEVDAFLAAGHEAELISRFLSERRGVRIQGQAIRRHVKGGHVNG